MPGEDSLRFSVRGLIVSVLIIGCGVGWLVRGARIQREAVQAIERERGHVRYNGEAIVWDGGAGSHDAWLRRDLGAAVARSSHRNRLFLYVTTVYLSQLPGGTEMVSVGRLSSLEELNLVEGSTATPTWQI